MRCGNAASPSRRSVSRNYDGFFGKLVARFLNGEFGPLAAVDPHFSALLYAGDRLESKPSIEAALASGKIVLADRYIASNLAHQGARMPTEKREEFIAWLKQLEYEVYGLPAEDLVLYLRVPAAEAHRLVGERGARDYTNLRRDLQEVRSRASRSGLSAFTTTSRASRTGRKSSASIQPPALFGRPKRFTLRFSRHSTRASLPRTAPG